MTQRTDLALITGQAGVAGRSILRCMARANDLSTTSSSKPRLRDASRVDVVALMKMMVKFNRSEGIRWRPKRVEPALNHLLDDPRLGRVLVASDDGDASLCGYCVATFNYDLEFAGLDAFVTELYVVDRLRGQGLGRQLLEAMAAQVRADGARALHLLVSPDNHAALQLYRGAGFVEVPRLMMTRTFPRERGD